MNPLLTLEHVGFAYHQAEGETPALSDISFTLEAGHFLAIVGPSGCGKSTLIKVISGFINRTEERLFMTERRTKIWASTSLSSLESRSSIRICLFFPI